MVCVGPEPTDPEKTPTIMFYAEGKPDKRRTRRVKLGRYPLMKADQAKAKAMNVLSLMKQ
jgi:hypothetical protein